MAAKTSAVASKLTGADILAIINRNGSNEERTFGDAVVDFTSDKLNSLTTGVSRIGAAATVGVRNAGNHFAIERALQTVRSDAKLKAAANRAAERINALTA